MSSSVARDAQSATSSAAFRKRKRRRETSDGGQGWPPGSVRVERDAHCALDTISAMWGEAALKDCCLVVHEEGRVPVELWAHRAVLSAASRPFRGMLAGGLREHGAHRLELREVAAAPMSEVLAFIYGQPVTIDTTNALPLYRVADLYEVLALAQECCSFLKQHVTAQNCCALLSDADAVHCRPITEHCMDILKAHFGVAAEHDDFVSLPFPLLLELVRLDDLRAPSEEAVLTAVLKWVEHNGSRREKLPTLAAELRWPFISPARLVQFERERAELLREFPQLVDFTREAYRYQALASHPGVTPDDVKALTSPRTRRRGRFPDFARLRFKAAIGSKGSGRAEFNCPEGVAMSSDGQLIVVGDSLNHRVQIFNSDGEFVREFGQKGHADGQFDMPGGVTIGTVGAVQGSRGDEHIVVTDQGNGRIQVFTRDGAFVRCIGRAGTQPGCLMEPTGVAVTPEGNVAVADYANHRVQIFSGTGEVMLVIGQEGSAEGEFNHPSGLAVSQAGDIYVADYQNDRIQVFKEDGTFVRTIGCTGDEAGFFDRPFDVAVSGSEILITDYENHRIQVFAAEDGTFLHAFGSHGDDDSNFDSPGGIAVSRDGLVCVTDCGNGRFQLFSCGSPDA